MITKLRRIQHSWAIKLILILTALSFMSLFGVSSYVNSATSNKPVIKVDSTKISTNEIMSLYNRDIQTARNLFGQNLEISDSMKNSILSGIVQRELNNIIIKKTAHDKGIDISKDLIKKIIRSQREFTDQSGKFDLSLFKRFLSMSYQSEAMYVSSLALDLEKQFLVSEVVSNIVFPESYKPYLSQAGGLKKVFQYIKIEPTALPVGRAISQDELEQYYLDFAPDFMAPETRDVSYIYIPAAKDYDKTVELSNQIEDAIGGGANLSEVSKQFNAPVLNVIGLNEEGDAKNLSSNKSLVATSDFVNTAFSYNEKEISKVVETDDGFFVLEIVKINPTYQLSVESVKPKIEKMWKSNEQVAIAQEISNDVSHDLENGDKLPEIAKRFSLSLKTTPALSKGDVFEGINADDVEELFKEAVGNVKIIETATAKIIAVPISVSKGGSVGASLLNEVISVLQSEASQNLINSYGKDYSIRVRYKYLGL